MTDTGYMQSSFAQRLYSTFFALLYFAQMINQLAYAKLEW